MFSFPFLLIAMHGMEESHYSFILLSLISRKVDQWNITHPVATLKHLLPTIQFLISEKRIYQPQLHFLQQAWNHSQFEGFHMSLAALEEWIVQYQHH